MEKVKEYNNCKVWVVNWAGHVLKDAERFGDILVMTEGRVDIFNLDRLTHEMVQKLEDFDPKDFLIPSGHIVLCLVVFGIILQKTETVKLLIWNPKAQQYKPRNVNIKDVMEATYSVKES